mgnify:CR=1 FL=1
MRSNNILRDILPEVLVDNFDIVRYEKSADRFDIWLDEKKVQLREDKYNSDVIAYGFGEYHEIRDFPIRGRATYLHARKRKWLDNETGEIFSYDWDLSEHDRTRLNSEFVAFLKEGD